MNEVGFVEVEFFFIVVVELVLEFVGGGEFL